MQFLTSARRLRCPASRGTQWRSVFLASASHGTQGMFQAAKVRTAPKMRGILLVGWHVASSCCFKRFSSLPSFKKMGWWFLIYGKLPLNLWSQDPATVADSIWAAWHHQPWQPSQPSPQSPAQGPQLTSDFAMFLPFLGLMINVEKCCVFGWWFQRFVGFQLSTIEMDNDPQWRAYFSFLFQGSWNHWPGLKMIIMIVQCTLFDRLIFSLMFEVHFEHSLLPSQL